MERIPRSLPGALPWALAGLTATLLVVQTLRLRWRAFATRRRLGLQAVRAQAGEARAATLLGRRGYAVVARQAPGAWQVRRGDEAQAFTLRADYLVERGGRRFVAEVKTGAAAPSLSASATRRQLLEYACAFDVDGVLLVDPEAGTVEEVVFELPRAARSPGPLFSVFLIGIAVGAAAVVAILRLLDAR
ncbi:MAG TPA: hypothetical protein VMZ28_07550 [Kofleriaceae bacterium]|nr:hypothetical protein [Kofleriaceae bacterium]